MKKILLGLCMVGALHGAPVLAQSAPVADPAVAAAVKELFVAMKYRETIQASYAEMQKNLPVIMSQSATSAINADKSLTEAQRSAALAQMEKRIPAAVTAFSESLNDPALIDQMIAEIVPVYARYFSLADIGQIAAFYKTPVGVKMLATTPQVTSEMMQISQKVLMPRLGKLIEKLTENQ